MTVETNTVDVASSEPGIPPLLASQLGHGIRRVVLVANNKGIGAAVPAQWIDQATLLVFFNCPVRLAIFNEYDNPRLFCFRGNGRNHWGLPPNKNRVDEMEKLIHRSLVTMVCWRYLPTAIDELPPGVQGMIADKKRFSLISRDHDAWRDYPNTFSVKERCHRVPSTGFAFYRVFLRLLLQQTRPENNHVPFEIVTLGFNHVIGGHFWDGHDWAFERSELQTTPAGVHHVPIADE